MKSKNESDPYTRLFDSAEEAARWVFAAWELSMVTAAAVVAPAALLEWKRKKRDVSGKRQRRADANRITAEHEVMGQEFNWEADLLDEEWLNSFEPIPHTLRTTAPRASCCEIPTANQNSPRMRGEAIALHETDHQIEMQVTNDCTAPS